LLDSFRYQMLAQSVPAECPDQCTDRITDCKAEDGSARDCGDKPASFRPWLLWNPLETWLSAHSTPIKSGVSSRVLIDSPAVAANESHAPIIISVVGRR
jgi:hypothetical protein